MEWSWLRHSSLLRFSVTMYDYQAMCEPPDHRHSAAQALISVSDPQAVFLLGHILYPVLQDITWSHPHPAPDLALANQDPVLMLTPPGAVGLSCGGGVLILTSQTDINIFRGPQNWSIRDGK